MQALQHYSVVMKRELSKKAKLLIFKAVFGPVLTNVLGNDRKNAIKSASVRNKVLQRIKGVSLFNKMRSSEIRKPLNIEPLLLRIERSQFR